MENNYIGNIIFYERNRRNLAVADVCRGLCDRSVYSRIENGSYKGEIHLIIAVLQRLGISGSKVGRYLCRDEYDEMDFRFEILEYIKSYQLDEAKDALAEYSDRYCKGSILNTQFAEYMEARINEINGNLERALDLYKKAAAYTVADYSTCSSFVCISVYEYFMIANVARLTARFGNEEEAIALYEKLLEYCKNTDIEKWNITCMYPKTICEMMQINTPGDMGNYDRQRWLERCDAALNILRDTSRLHFLCPLLKNRQTLIGMLGMEPDKQWDDFLVHYEKLRGEYYISGELFEWYPYYINGGFYSVERLIDERRHMLGMTMEELADGVCAAETVSRIINKKISSKNSTIAALLEKMGLKGVLCERVIVSDEMEAHKQWDVLVQCNSISDSITAKKMYDKLAGKLNISIKINRMVLEYKKAELDLQNEDVDYRKLAERHEKMLGFSIEHISELTSFTEIEVMIINRYFYCMDRINDYTLLGNYEEMCRVYSDKGSMCKAFASQYEGILARCASYMGNMGDFERSNYYARQGIILELECERMHVLSTLLYCVPWNKIESGEKASENDFELCECAYQIAWYSREDKRMQLYKNWINNNLLQ